VYGNRHAEVQNHPRISAPGANPGAVKNFLPLLKATFASWSAHNAPRMGAALAFYTALSLAPLVLLVVGIVSLVVEQDAARARIVTEFSTLIGKEGGATIETILAHAPKGGGGTWAAVIGFAALLFGASAVFGELQESLNAIWEVPPRKRRWITLIRDRLLSMATVFVLGFLVLVSLLLSAGIAALSASMTAWLPGARVIWECANTLVLLLVVTLLFAALFRLLPDVKVAWRDVWTGAAMTAALFIIGKFLLGFYIGRSAFASAYGAAGSLVIVLLWVFYSAQIFFFGAEFTRAFAQRHGSHCHGPRELKCPS
jgi:membrane protein